MFKKKRIKKTKKTPLLFLFCLNQTENVDLNQLAKENNLTITQLKCVTQYSNSSGHYTPVSVFRIISTIQLKIFLGIFGQSLEDTYKYSHDKSSLVPLIVRQCCEYLLENGLTFVGLFR